ncbi:MAG: Coenzyme F420 hydrogenase/dehydrogenase, beta subunit C-terminal domain, partial [Candidatus Brocadiia bacterium]
MKKGLIDAAIVNGKDDRFRPVPYIAASPEELGDSIGYKPSQAPTLSLIGEAINREFTDIAVVGTPCQMQGLRKLQNHPRFDFEAYDLVTLAIGTFCFGTFHNQRLAECLNEQGVKMADIQEVSMDRDFFKMIVTTSSGTKKIPLNHLYDQAI